MLYYFRVDTYTFLSRSPVSTLKFGQRLGEKLMAGDIIALTWELGCGKTLLTKGICVGLGVSERYVNSPTFVFANEYSGKLPVFHIDLYRLGDITEGFDIGLQDYLAKADLGVLVLEWAEKILPLLPENYLKVQFTVLSARRRQIELAGLIVRFSSLLGELGEQ